MESHRVMSLFAGRASHPVILLALSLLSFLYFRWLFWDSATGLSVDGIYFGGLLFVSVAYGLHLLSLRRYHLDRALVVHLCVIVLAAATVLWSPGKSTGLREVAAMVYVWLFHFFFRNVRPNRVLPTYTTLTSILAVLLLLTYLSVGAGWLTGDFDFSPDEGEEIGDVAGYFVMPMDLVSVLAFFALSLMASGVNRAYHAVLFVSSSVLLLMNFSKTYMAATVIAWLAFWVIRSRSVWSALKILSYSLLPMAMLLFTNNPLSRQLFFDQEMTLGLFLSAPHLYFSVLNTSGRLSIWEYLLTEAFAVNGPWIGAGLGAAREILSHNPFGEAGFAAHSDYAKILADFGVLGVCLYLLLIFLFARRYARLIRHARDRVLAAIGGAGLMMTLYIAIGGVGYEMMNRPRSILLVYFAVLGLSYALEKQGQRTATRGKTLVNASVAHDGAR